MIGVYNPLLTSLSVVVAFLASCTALEGTAMLNALTSRWRHVWLAASACAMGVGIWSMHFIGMIALTLPISIGYDVGATVASLLLAVLASLVALATASRGHRLSLPRLLTAGVAMGVGVAGMHYTGMYAMRMSPGIEYDAGRVAASIAVAIGASVGALWLSFHLRDSERECIVWKRLGAAAVMAFAIAGMHYVGMSAATFAAGSVCLGTHRVDADALALTVAGASSAILIGTLCVFGIQASRLFASLKAAANAVHHLGTHDALTDLPNRAHLVAKANEALARNARAERLLAVLFIDLDGFKAINDTLGHRIGDDLLRQVAERLSACVRRDDLVARLGGDEFVIFANGLPDADAADAMAGKILARLGDEFLVDATIPVRIGASIGIALANDALTSIDTLIAHADCAMYAAKHDGRHTFRRFETRMQQSALRLLQIQRDLHFALARDEFDLAFQPKLAMNGNTMIGAEALPRWVHPLLGDVSPREFMAAAERAGLVVALGEWVLKKTCDHIVAWDRRGLTLVPIAIGLSALQFRMPQLAARIDAIVEAAGVLPHRLMFGISEATAMHDVGHTSRAIASLRERGYAVVLHDFGAAFSSLGHLQDFKVDQIQVDRAFVSGADAGSPRGAALLSAVVALARVLSIEVVAEGGDALAQPLSVAPIDASVLRGVRTGSPLSARAFQDAMSGRADALA